MKQMYFVLNGQPLARSPKPKVKRLRRPLDPGYAATPLVSLDKSIWAKQIHESTDEVQRSQLRIDVCKTSLKAARYDTKFRRKR